MTNWKPSDAEVDAACKAHACGLYPGIDIDFDQVEGDPRDTKLWPAMTAALIAAHDAAPEPDTTEFEVALDDLIKSAAYWAVLDQSGSGSADSACRQLNVAESVLIAMYKERR